MSCLGCGSYKGSNIKRRAGLPHSQMFTVRVVYPHLLPKESRPAKERGHIDIFINLIYECLFDGASSSFASTSADYWRRHTSLDLFFFL